jgi:hypothetical protein
MGYVLFYLMVGAATFWPMLHFDYECRENVLSGGRWAIAASWAIWCVIWLPSLAVDLVFWVIGEPD